MTSLSVNRLSFKLWQTLSIEDIHIGFAQRVFKFLITKNTIVDLIHPSLCEVTTRAYDMLG